MSGSQNVKLWYFTGMVGDRIIHVEHDVFSKDNGTSIARAQAQRWFDNGVNVDGEIVEFDRVIAISEDHETALDIKRGSKE